MEKLSSKDFESVKETIKEIGRPLEHALMRYHLKDSSVSTVIRELTQFQNQDGGFGHGLEPDFRLDDSSAAATNIAFQILVGLEQTDEVLDVAKNTISYLENTFDKDRMGWYNVPEEVNRVPHAEWWTVDKDTGKSGLDNAWGNPSAELIGYMFKYRQFVDNLDVEELVSHAVKHLQNLRSYSSEHEIYAYVNTYPHLSEDTQEEIIKYLTIAVGEIVSLNVNEWIQYVPKPLDIVSSPDDPKFGIYEQSIEENLNYVKNQLEQNAMIEPSWSWSSYHDAWENARNEWIGILTLDALQKLDNFDLISN